MQKKKDLPRITEHNDWVAFILFGCIAALVLILQYLHRESSLRGFIAASLAESGNIFPTWAIISVLHVLLLATLLSQYLPAVPRAINDFSFFGISLNKFGYTFWAAALFYMLKVAFGYLFYAAAGQEKRWHRLWFVASKYYMVAVLAELALVFVNYYLPVNRELFFFGLSLSVPFFLLAKILYYLLGRPRVLPAEWYYKILYICTLQIAPLLALWRLLFF